MGYANQENQTYASAVTLAADKSFAAIESRNNATAAFGGTWTGATNHSAVVKLQESIDGTNWLDIAGQTQTLSTNSGIIGLKINNQTMIFPYVRAVLTATGETTGTLNLAYFLKGDR